MRNIKLLVEYDGTDYHGFQRQGSLSTIQLMLEDAILDVTRERVTVTGAGRTDAGVHATGQVVNFHTESRIPAERFPYALNSRLPRDIAVTAAEEVSPDFHSSRDAKSKLYVYLIRPSAIPSPLWRRYALHVPPSLDLGLMARAARLFEGVHDFSLYRASGSSARTAVRTVYRCELAGWTDGVWTISVEADGFLYKMVRMIVGTLLQVGRGKLALDDVARSLDGFGGPAGDRPEGFDWHGEIGSLRERLGLGETVPPHGLVLRRVCY